MNKKIKLYNQKRDFKKTKEPEGIVQNESNHWKYLIQKHAARRLHYDLRLEFAGVLKSWAVTRGPSLNPHDRRLAVEVEDHPIKYGEFEGTIPKNQYGGGTVMLWDTGTWEPIGDVQQQLRDGKLNFKLHGQRLQGEWSLIRMQQPNRKQHQWLLIKKHDDYATSDNAGELLTRSLISIVSGRTMEEIALSNQQAVHVEKKRPRSKIQNSLPKALLSTRKSAPMPALIIPQLATLTTEPPEGNEWLHEIKFDGYRVLARISQGKVQLFTRSQQDWTHKFKTTAEALSNLNIQEGWFDGEIVAVKNERSNFQALQEAISFGQHQNLQYYLFDILYLNGVDLRTQPLSVRKEILEKLLLTLPQQNQIFYSEHFKQEGKGLLQRSCSLQLEGIVSKLASAGYVSGRTRTWLKTKCHHTQEFIIGGFTDSTDKSRGLGALLLGCYQDEQLQYAGKVGTGFSREVAQRLREQLIPLKVKKSPFANEVPSAIQRTGHWLQPSVVCEIIFSEWSAMGRLRHPVFLSLREDKPAEEVSCDRLQIINSEDKPKPKQSTGKTTIAETVITHPGKLFYTELGITKMQIAEYYAKVSSKILPHIINRPISILRCPDGIDKQCFFQRHWLFGAHHIHDVPIAGKNGASHFIMIKDIHGLIELVQAGVLELHPWGSTAKTPNLPDRIVFDLDPDPELPWHDVVIAAEHIREYCKAMGLISFLKTTGGKGLHVVMPIKKHYDWNVIKEFTRAIAVGIAMDYPDKYVANMNKQKRKGKIFIDYLRNQFSATAVAPYSMRARPSGLVSMPIPWPKSEHSSKPDQFSIKAMMKIITTDEHDPWKDFFEVEQSISKKVLHLLKVL